METQYEHHDDRHLLAIVDGALDALGDDRVRLHSDADLLELLQVAIRVGAKLSAWQKLLAAQIETGEVAWRERKNSTTTWLAEAENLTPREAARLIRSGMELARFPVVAHAAGTGRVLPGQADAISQVLAKLPSELDGATVVRAQELMVGFADTHNAAELGRLATHLLEVVCPETADELEAERLERERRQATRDRYLAFRNNGHGSILVRGSLPVADAEPLIRIVDAYAAAQKRAFEAADPRCPMPSPGQRRADGLLALVEHHQRQAVAPNHGGDRPRAVITLSYDTLLKAANDAGLVDPFGRIVGTGEPVSPSTVRQLLCDADLLPAVLGGSSEVLDVGRTRRLVTPAIRAALEIRDGGCMFPGCDKAPQACHAHHGIPWWVGGPTALTNLFLLCPHHHNIVEPSRDPASDRWTIRLGSNSVPEITPPRRVDPRQKPRIHARFMVRRQ
ncbi:DUF222 domain-containing protein [Micropruina sp.]|uniref:HNH endonuclease signature motif containing protein n=1 Tax=Micropruina sp. TaxID=2737536 RepID=UPI0039E4B082